MVDLGFRRAKSIPSDVPSALPRWGGNTREIVFGIRTIVRNEDMSYWLNGKRLYLKGAWYPIADIFGSKPTRRPMKKI